MQAGQSLTEPKPEPKTKSLNKFLIKKWAKCWPNFGLFQMNETDIFPATWVVSSSYATFQLTELWSLCTMYSVIVQCNACIFHSFFVWLIIVSTCEPKIYLKEIIKRRGKALSFTLNCLFVYINWFWERIFL